ncbi:MAG: glycosyltransferase family 1 protein [Spirochaetales bacterium]|nr:glycosyltransferase family 1 protein [Spirochaetales bacterium]
MNKQLLKESEGKDLVFVGKGEIISPETFRIIRKRNTLTAIWYGDFRPKPPPWLVGLLQHTDFFFMTSGGDTLKTYAEAGIQRAAAFFLNPSDPDLVKSFDLRQKKSGVLFTATPYYFAGDERKEVINYLKKRKDVTFFGGAQYTLLFGQNRLYNRILQRLLGYVPLRTVRGDDYIHAIMSAQIGVGVNAANNIFKYSSDRLTHYLSFGTLYLARKFPGVRELFDDSELICFDTEEDLAEKLKYYLRENDEMLDISRKGQKKMLEKYNTKEITAMLLDVMQTGRSDRFPWVEVISN